MEALITPVDTQLMAGDLIEYEGKNMIAIQVLIDYMDDNLTKVCVRTQWEILAIFAS